MGRGSALIATSSISWKLCLGLSSSHSATKYRLVSCRFESALPQVASDYQIIKQFALWGLCCWHLFVPKAAWTQTWRLSRGFSFPGQWKEPKCSAPVSASQIAGTGCHESSLWAPSKQSGAGFSCSSPDMSLCSFSMKGLFTSVAVCEGPSPGRGADATAGMGSWLQHQLALAAHLPHSPSEVE